MCSLLHGHLCDTRKQLTLRIATMCEVSNYEYLWMSGEAQVWFHHHSSCTIELRTGSTGQHATQRRGLDTSCPENRPCGDDFAFGTTTKSDYCWLNIRDGCACADLNPQASQCGGRFRGERGRVGWQDMLHPFHQYDPRLSRVDLAEVVL